MHLRSQFLAIVLALPAIPLAAETWVLHDYKHWTVKAMTHDDGSIGCLMQNHAPDEDIAFWISLDKFGLDGNLYDHRANYRNYDEGHIGIEIDRQGEWTIPAHASGPNVWFDIPDDADGRLFLGEIWGGNRAYFDTDMNGKWDYWFSLSGSAAAMKAFAECAQRID